MPDGDAVYAYDPSATAVNFAQHYLGTIARRAGLGWDDHNDDEVALMVEAIVDAARQDQISAGIRRLSDRLDGMQGLPS